MTEKRWPEIEALFDRVAEQPAGERDRILAEADPEVRDAVARLLEADEKKASAIQAAVDDIQSVLSDEEPVSQHFGPWRVIEPIGRGGMGSVYLAKRDDGAFDKQAAIKVLDTAFTVPLARERFLQERRILATLDHPGIARLIDGGETDDDVPYLVMEYVDGSNFIEYCSHHRLDRDARLRLFLDICAAVSYAHQSLVVHRDLKPANVFVNRDGRIKLLDFGIAKLLSPDAAQTTDQALSPRYASPEQVRGEPITTATDIYSLGVLLYELLTGRLPYQITKMTPFEVDRAVCETPAAPANVSDDLDMILQMALRKEPQRRYASVRDFAEDIERAMTSRPVKARPDTILYRSRKFVARNRIALVAGLIVAVALIGAAAVSRRQAERADRRFAQVRKLSSRFLFDFDNAIAPLAGSTSAREMVVSTALEYLDSLAGDSSGDVELQQELAAAYEKVGDVQGSPSAPSLGRHSDALVSYRRSIDLWTGALSRNPGNLAGRKALAQVLMKTGDLQLRTGLPKEANESFTLASQMADIALSGAPDDAGSQFISGGVLFRKGEQLRAANDPAGAQAMYEKSGALFARSISRQPSPRYESALALAQTRIGLVLIEQDRPKESIPYLQSAVDLRRKLAAQNPLVASYQRSLSIALVSLGDPYGLPQIVNLGDARSAENYLREGLAIQEHLEKADPADQVIRQDVMVTLLQLAEVLAESRPAEAIALCDRAHQEVALEKEAVQQRTDVRQQLIGLEATRARALFGIGQYSKALAVLGGVREALRREGKDAGDSGISPLRLATLESNILARLGRKGEALEATKRAITVASSSNHATGGASLTELRDLAAAYQQLESLGDPADACGAAAGESEIWKEWRSRKGQPQYPESRRLGLEETVRRCPPR